MYMYAWMSYMHVHVHEQYGRQPSTDLVYVFLSGPREGAGVTSTEDEDGIVVWVAIGRVDHGEEGHVHLPLAQLVGSVKHHTSHIVGLGRKVKVH